MQRITTSNVEGAFKRLHKAMEWPDLPPYENGKPNVGAVYLYEGKNGASWNIEIIVNDGGGVQCPFTGWQTKREAFEAMCSMAQAVETYKHNKAV